MFSLIKVLGIQQVVPVFDTDALSTRLSAWWGCHIHMYISPFR